MFNKIFYISMPFPFIYDSMVYKNCSVKFYFQVFYSYWGLSTRKQKLPIFKHLTFQHSLIPEMRILILLKVNILLFFQ